MALSYSFGPFSVLASFWFWLFFIFFGLILTLALFWLFFVFGSYLVSALTWFWLFSEFLAFTMLVILAVFIVLIFWLFSMKLALLHNFWLLTAFVVYAVPNNCTFGMYERAITRLGRVGSVGSGRSGRVGRVGSGRSGSVA